MCYTEQKNPKVGKMSSALERHLYKDAYCHYYIRKTGSYPMSPKCLSVWDQLNSYTKTLYSHLKEWEILSIFMDMERGPKYFKF